MQGRARKARYFRGMEYFLTLGRRAS
jgi:hypothetical protein